MRKVLWGMMESILALNKAFYFLKNKGGGFRSKAIEEPFWFPKKPFSEQ